MENAHIGRDRKTLEAIGSIYCATHHVGGKDAAGLCPACRETVDATLARTKACPNGHEGNCQDCKIHCQSGEARGAGEARRPVPYSLFCGSSAASVGGSPPGSGGGASVGAAEGSI